MHTEKMFVKENSAGIFRMSRKKILIICTTIVAIVVALMAVAAFFDYQID
jgi:hypothetical protein